MDLVSQVDDFLAGCKEDPWQGEEERERGKGTGREGEDGRG